MFSEKTYKTKCEGDGAAVLVWIHGGGFILGSKVDGHGPYGLLTEGEKENGQEIIFVAMKYRMGAFRFLSGPTFQSNGTANVGLLDQRLALEWFAGEGSGTHHIVAYGGTHGPSLFQQAVPQSPISIVTTSDFDSEEILHGFVRAANVSTIQEARNLSSEFLRLANYVQITGSPWRSFTYRPAVDGNYIPSPPGPLSLDGAYENSLTIMTGYNDDEGLVSSPPFSQTDHNYLA